MHSLRDLTSIKQIFRGVDCGLWELCEWVNRSGPLEFQAKVQGVAKHHWACNHDEAISVISIRKIPSGNHHDLLSWRLLWTVYRLVYSMVCVFLHGISLLSSTSTNNFLYRGVPQSSRRMVPPRVNMVQVLRTDTYMV